MLHHRESRLVLNVLTLIAVAAAAACRDEPVAPSEAPPAPAFAISDGMFNHGNPRFFFLPPVVPHPTYSGQPDGTLKPHVLVCEWRQDVDRCGTVVADFGATGGTGSQTVRYDASAGQYIVNWDTKTCVTGACTLNTSAIYRIRVFVGGSQLGFADVDPTDNGKEVKNLASSDYITLVNGRTLPVKFRIEKGAIAVVAPGDAAPVGPAGGSVTVAGEAATLDIPSGALSATANISVAQATAPPAGLIPDLAPVVSLGPDGTQFAKPVLLTLPFDPSKLPAGVPPSALGVFTPAGTGWQEVAGSVVDGARATVTAPISHFSVYSIRVRPSTATGTPTPTTITAGDSTVVSSQAYGYYVFPTTVCYPQFARVGSWWSSSWIYVGQYCYTYAQTYTYALQNLAVSWSSSNSGVASVAPGPTFTNVQGVAASPTIHGEAAGGALISASAGGLTSQIGITVTPANTPRIVILSLRGARPEAPKYDVYVMNPDGSDARVLAPTLDEQEEYPDLSWDTRTVVFGSTRTGSFQIFRINADGSGLAQVTNLGFYTRAPRLSPNAARIAFYSDAEGRFNLYTVDAGATMAGLGGVKRVTNDPDDEIQPDWSPDGQRLVFSSNRTGSYQIYTLDLGTGYERQITFDAGDHLSAHWSPTGSLLTYSNTPSNTLWTVNPDDGRPPTQITSGANDAAPVWSPDGSQVLFASGRSAGPYFQLHVVSVSGGTVSHYLTTPDETIAFAWHDPSIQPPAAPTGLVALLSTRGSRPEAPKNDVFLMNPDGTNLRALSPTLDEQEEYPDLAPDRHTVVFGSTRTGAFQIFRIGTDGSGLAQITNMGFYTRAPRLSPDGSRVAFYSDAAGAFRIYAVPATAVMAGLADATRLTDGPGDDFLADWSPDGRRIVYSSTRTGNSQLFVRDLTVGGDRQITFDAGDHLFARWAPSGSRIAYVNAASNTIWSVDADAGTAPTQLTGAGGGDGSMSWSPDGQKLLFGTARAGLSWFQLFIMNADGSGLVRFSDTQDDLGAPAWR